MDENSRWFKNIRNERRSKIKGSLSFSQKFEARFESLHIFFWDELADYFTHI